MMTGLREFWAARNPRERQWLAAMAAVVGIALLAQLLWSAHLARDKLQRQLPALRLQTETTRANAAEWRRLHGQAEPGTPLTGNALERALHASAEDLGGNLTLRLTGARQLTVEGETSFDRWVLWVAKIHSEQHLRLVRCDLQPADTPGRVHVMADFAGPPEP